MKLVTITKPCEIDMGRKRVKFPIPGEYWVTEAWLDKLRDAEAVKED